MHHLKSLARPFCQHILFKCREMSSTLCCDKYGESGELVGNMRSEQMSTSMLNELEPQTQCVCDRSIGQMTMVEVVLCTKLPPSIREVLRNRPLV